MTRPSNDQLCTSEIDRRIALLTVFLRAVPIEGERKTIEIELEALDALREGRSAHGR
jgi:hypothetical protein